MNPVTFNDPITTRKVFETGGVLKSALDAPIFVGSEFEDDSLNGGDVIGAFMSSLSRSKSALPFPVLRLHLKPNKIHGQDYKSFKFWIGHRREVLLVTAHMEAHTGSEGVYVFEARQEPNGSLSVQINVLAKEGGVHAFHHIDTYRPDLRDWAIESVHRLIGAIAVYFEGFENGTDFPAEVRPNKQGKSVEWMKARTHYVLLHKSHPANQKTVTEGASVTEDERHLKRQAHSRRAHFRILRSPKFKNKSGQKIRVKSCWVGPKEWKQGTSIYRLCE